VCEGVQKLELLRESTISKDWAELPSDIRCEKYRGNSDLLQDSVWDQVEIITLTNVSYTASMKLPGLTPTFLSGCTPTIL